HLSLIHRRVGEDEAVEIFQHGELGAADPVADRSGLAMGALGTDQAGNERIDLIAPGQSLARDLVEAGAHAIELELAHRVQNLVASHEATFLMLSYRRQSAAGSILSCRAWGVVMLGTGGGWRC